MSAAEATTERIGVEPGRPVELPSGDFIANAQMTREGTDLHLIGPDGHEIVIEGYFAQGTPPDLVTADGSRLSPQLVQAFVPPEHVGQYAASGQIANDASPAGRIGEVTGEATIVHADGTRTPATPNAPVFQGDVIETSKTGAVNIVFADNTSFAISESARMSVDKFIYDSEHQSGSSFFSMLQGVFVYTSGIIGKADPGSVNIDTPVGSIGIRGTVVAGQIAPSGHESKITILDGAIALTNGAGTHEMHEGFSTISLNSYQSQPTDLGRMDAHTFSQTFRSVATVAGDTFSHFSTAAPASTKADDHGDNAQQPASEAPAAAPQEAAPPAPGDSGAANAPAPVDAAQAIAAAATAAAAPALAALAATMPTINFGGMAAGMEGLSGGMVAGSTNVSMAGPVSGFDSDTTSFATTSGTHGDLGAFNYSPPPTTATAQPPAPPPPPPPAPDAFHLGFVFDPKYGDTVHLPNGPGIIEFASGASGVLIGKVNPFSASGAITYDITVDMTTPPQRIVTEYLASTDITAPATPTLDAATRADLTASLLTAGDNFTLQSGVSAPVTITITANESIDNLIADIIANGFHAELINNKLEISLAGGPSLTIADGLGSPASTLLGPSGINTFGPVLDYYLEDIDPNNTFSIDSAGNIYAIDPLALSHAANPSGFDLIIHATDALGHETTVTQHLGTRDLLPGYEPIVFDGTEGAGSSVTGTSGANLLAAVGSANLDLFGGGGADVIIGNIGNNLMVVDNTFKFVEGGAGADTLRFVTSGGQPLIDFTNSATGLAKNIETIDLGTSSASGNHIKLDLKSVFEMTDSSHTLHIFEAPGASTANSKVDIVTSGTGAFQLTSGTLSATPNDLTYTGNYNGANVTLVIHQGQTAAAGDAEIQVTQV